MKYSIQCTCVFANIIDGPGSASIWFPMLTIWRWAHLHALGCQCRGILNGGSPIHAAPLGNHALSNCRPAQEVHMRLEREDDALQRVAGHLLQQFLPLLQTRTGRNKRLKLPLQVQRLLLQDTMALSTRRLHACLSRGVRQPPLSLAGLQRAPRYKAILATDELAEGPTMTVALQLQCRRCQATHHDNVRQLLPGDDLLVQVSRTLGALTRLAIKCGPQSQSKRLCSTCPQHIITTFRHNPMHWPKQYWSIVRKDHC